MTELAGAFAAWSLEISMAAVALAAVVRTGRRRTAINEALHELRRPLQALALAPPPAGGEGAIESSVRLASAALDRLDREVNGGSAPPAREVVPCAAVLRAAVGRWRPTAVLGGGSLELRWLAGEAAVRGDREGVERAVDNLIVNAIEHGGPAIVVEGRREQGRLRVAVVDSGRPAAKPARPADRRRHGHGLRVVRRIAAEHGGRFVLWRGESGATAILELPLA